MPTPVGQKGGGMANAIVGTFELVGIACLIGVPIGVGGGNLPGRKSRQRLSHAIRFAADIMMGIPSIVIGIFVYA